jgi:hypothetical protein
VYRFQKLYMDLVDADGSVCIAYAADLRALGLSQHFGGIELYAPNGVREIHRATRVRWSKTNDSVEIRGDFADGWFLVRHRLTERGWDPAGSPACRGLSWCVLGARATAVVELARNGSAKRLSGTGYSDWVDVTRPTRLLGLAQVEWGRFHLPDGTFVYSRIRNERDETWQRALSIRAGSRIETTLVGLENRERSLVCKSDRTELVFSPTRVLHDGPVFDAERLPGAFERRVSELITGPAAERRVVGRVRRSGSPGSSALGWGIAESVRFGAEAAS